MMLTIGKLPGPTPTRFLFEGRTDLLEVSFRLGVEPTKYTFFYVNGEAVDATFKLKDDDVVWISPKGMNANPGGPVTRAANLHIKETSHEQTAKA